MKIQLIIISLLFSGLQIYAQDDAKLKVQEDLFKYFELPREQIYLHLNKSTYVTGEELWFKGYFYDYSRKTPSIATTNVEVGLYDDKGKQIQKKMFYGNKGYTSGNFQIDSTYSTGNYYIKASTNWLRNFKENHDYIQKIRVLNPANISNAIGNNGTFYDFQFLPEGGHLIEGVENSIGAKLIDGNGRGIPFVEAVIFDENDNKISTFKSNPFGLGKFVLNIEENTSYKAKIKLTDGTTIEAALPEAKKEGIALNVANVTGEAVFIKLSTNQKTYDRIKEQPFYIMFHQDRESSVGEVKFVDDKLTLVTSIKKEKLYSGLNTITIFDMNKKPLLERMIFNSEGLSYEKSDIVSLNTERSKDSITFHFNLTQEKQIETKNAAYNFSVSTLPESTISYNPEDNILFSFLLKPYLKGYVEKPSYYFQGKNPKKRHDLDVLLLTQGWSRYEWDAISSPPIQKFELEQGISINASVQGRAFSKAKKKRKNGSKIYQEVQFYIHPSEGEDPVIVPIDENNTISLKNLHLENDALKTSIITSSGKVIKANMNLEIHPKKEVDQLVVPSNLSPSIAAISSKQNEKELNEPFKSFIAKNTIELDGITIEGRRKKEDPDSYLISNDRRRKVTITANEVATFPLILDLIAFRGFSVITATQSLDVIITQQFSSTISINNDNVDGETRLSPIITIDGVRISDFNILRNLSTRDIETVYINPRDTSYGVRGAGGLIRITRRRTPIDYGVSSRPLNYIETPIDFPFESAKKFYTPKYNSYQSTTFDKYGVIHWSPDVAIDENGKMSITTIYIPGKKYTFYFEGMSENGDLISKIIPWKP